MTTMNDGNLLHVISGKLAYLNPALRHIAELVLEDPEATAAMTITQLAAATGVAESTVSRFAREMGLDGYRALRQGIAEANVLSRAHARADGQQFVYEGISRDEDPQSIVGKIERSSQESLHLTASHLNGEALDGAAHLIENANVLVFFAMGASSIAAEEGVLRFTRAGKKCLLFRDQSIQVMSATVLNSDDVVIAISDSGHSSPIVSATTLAREQGAASIVVTSSETSPLVAHADVALFTSSLPGGGLYGEAVTSKWGQLLVIDTLYATYASRHFDETLSSLEKTYAAGIEHSRRE